MKNRLVKNIKQHLLSWSIGYLAVYLLWFRFLEATNTVNYHVIHCRLDNLIPFNEYFIPFYLYWFVYIAFALILLLRDKKYSDEYFLYAVYLSVGMSICLLICTIFPNGTDFRPSINPDANWATRLVAMIYATDTPTNVFPSIHVYNAVGTYIALSRHYKNNRVISFFNFVSMIMICASTVFLKQHSVIDVAGGSLLSFGMYHLVYGKVPIPDVDKIPALGKKREKKKVWA